MTIDKNNIPHYGKDAKLPGSEDALQKACCQYLEWHPRRPLYFHPANGGSRNKVEAAKFKGMGVKAGVSDLVILEPNTIIFGPGIHDEVSIDGYYGLMVELKAANGKLSEAQTDFLLAAQKRGYKIAVVYTFDEFKTLIDNYLK